MNTRSLIFPLILLVTIISNCVNSDDAYIDNCNDETDGFGDTCGFLPIPTEDDEPIDVCAYVQHLVDSLENNDKQNILIDDRGNQPVIGAPHGAADLGTEDIADKVGDSLDFSSVRFFRFRTVLNTNVNRPTLGGVPADDEAWDYNAASVYHCFLGNVLTLFEANPNSFYAEIHGNDRDESTQRIEIVCSPDFTDNQDADIRDIFQDEIVNTYGIRTQLGAYTLRTHPDSIYFTASATRSCGLFCYLDFEEIPAIHIEIPAFYRGNSESSNERAQIVDMLKNALQRINDEVL